jgi:DNA-binding NarL/FixJ family response regulator
MIKHFTGSGGHLPNTPDGYSTEGERIKILIADDHETMRKGLRKIIENEKDFVIVAEAANGEEAVNLALDTKPDIVIMDVRMPVLDGIQATHRIISEMPFIRVIGVSFWNFTMIGQRMKRAGASAYLRKDKLFETLCTTIRKEAAMKD